ncbi:hypothetical protein F5Y10DRAFT_200665 [Nemania abortiva]|nr:hypothetical protein F5Y10DRAFT_200665 [Nemania abortiva]
MPTTPFVCGIKGSVEAPSPPVPARHESGETSSEDTKRCPDVQLQILQVLEQLRDCQRDNLALQRGRWDLALDIPQVARDLWANGPNAWTGLDTEDFWADAGPGKVFLKTLIPDPENLRRAYAIISLWVRVKSQYWAHWDKDFLADPRLTEEHIINNNYQPPAEWELTPVWRFDRDYRDGVGCCNFFVYASPNTESFGEPFDFKWSDPGGVFGFKNFSETLESDRDICGIIAQFAISRDSDVIDLGNAAAIVSLAPRGQVIDNRSFLYGHIAKWQERPANTRCYMGFLDRFQVRGHSGEGDLLSPPVLEYLTMGRGVFLHYMRSFIVVDSNEKAPHTKPHAPGFKCLRDQIAFKGFFDGTKTALIEKRYSTALGLLPLQKPAGNYALVSICDGQQEDVFDMFSNSPGGRKSEHVRRLEWRKYGIYPAGLYTGVSMLQLQICVFIDSWEQDWASTITRIIEKVSLKFDVLKNDENLKNLVLENSTDASVLYFKVLQILNNFSDMVRAAPTYLDTLSHAHSLFPDEWFGKSYPHIETTQAVLGHNWNRVRDRQRDATNRTLAKLEQTANEVKGFQDTIFNIVAINEARKSRTLNKYLMIFTIVTILFLPPTFVATFFGIRLFEDNTYKIFWVVLGGLSGGTYLFAALGLYGTSLLADGGKKSLEETIAAQETEWGKFFGESVIGQIKSLVACFRKKTQRGLRDPQRWIKDRMPSPQTPAQVGSTGAGNPATIEMSSPLGRRLAGNKPSPPTPSAV